ncbi:MAG: ATP-binding protein [Phycisphaerales bacterium]|nr:ATP-binding protein [Phycisphaerales bacterium]
MIPRSHATASLKAALKRAPVVALVGARQCGKSTLARAVVDPSSDAYFDLEDPADLARLEQPMVALRSLRGLVVIDEVQHRPDLFPILRVLADRPRTPARFLVLGSASPSLLRQTGESLAGRIETIVLGGFTLEEVARRGRGNVVSRHWERGGFPRSYLARSATDSLAWRRNFVRTYLARDVPQLGISIPAQGLLRFWSMLAHWHGQIWNAAQFSRALGVGESTARRYLDLLSDLFLVRQLQPWFANIAKRQVKSPKVYVRDSGLLHALLGVTNRASLLRHPKVGASWEGWIIEDLINGVEPDECSFWATHQGAELGLLLVKNGRRAGVEIKRSDAPTMTPSLRSAQADLGLERIVVFYPGEKRYAIAAGIEAVPASELKRARAGIELLGFTR